MPGIGIDLYTNDQRYPLAGTQKERLALLKKENMTKEIITMSMDITLALGFLEAKDFDNKYSDSKSGRESQPEEANGQVPSVLKSGVSVKKVDVFANHELIMDSLPEEVDNALRQSIGDASEAILEKRRDDNGIYVGLTKSLIDNVKKAMDNYLNHPENHKVDLKTIPNIMMTKEEIYAERYNNLIKAFNAYRKAAYDATKSNSPAIPVIEITY